MAEAAPPPSELLITLNQAAKRLETDAKSFANIARQHGFCTAVGRELFFTEAQLKSLKALLKDRARAEQRERVEARKKKPKSTFGIHESTDLRKERRRTKKRQGKKEE